MLVLIVLLMSLTCYSQTKIDPNPLFKIKIEEKWGFMNKSGEIVIKPEYSQAQDFCDGLAAVLKYEPENTFGKWGFIDKKGNLVIPCKFSIVSDFSDGYATVREGDGMWETPVGVIDQTGEYVFKKNWAEVGAIYNGIFPYSSGTSLYDLKSGFAKVDGSILTEAIYQMAKPFSEDLAAVTKDGRTGFIDTSGELVIPFSIDTADNFSDGLAAVIVDEEKGLDWDFINKKGEIAFAGKFDYVESFSEGFAEVKKGDDWFYIDTNGKKVIELPSECNFTLGFSEGLAAVSIDGKYGFIDRSGKMIIEPQFDNTHGFKNGLAYVEIEDTSIYDKSYGYIDRHGEFVFGPRK